MTLNEYQERAGRTAQYPEQGVNILYCALKLAGEAGEFAEKVGKYWRNGGHVSLIDYTSEERMALGAELGDVMWYVAEAARQLNLSLDAVCQHNLDKLASRQARGVIKSEGDNR